MKTYVLDIVKRLKRYSESLDVKTILCSKEWLVFNDSGDREVYIFRADGTVFITVNGIGTKATWSYEPTNKSLFIEDKNQVYMLHPAFLDNVIFALQLDGTNRYTFMIEANNSMSFAPKTLDSLNNYFAEKEEENARIERKAEEEKRKIEQNPPVDFSQSWKTPNDWIFSVSGVRKSDMGDIGNTIDAALKDWSSLKTKQSESTPVYDVFGCIAILIPISIFIWGAFVYPAINEKQTGIDEPVDLSYYLSVAGASIGVGFWMYIFVSILCSFTKSKENKRQKKILSIVISYFREHTNYRQIKISFDESKRPEYTESI